MSPSVCPTCEMPLDPARAPVVRVRGAKIVAYCSQECADGTGVTTEPSRSAAPARREEPASAPARQSAPAKDAPAVGKGAPAVAESEPARREEPASEPARREEPASEPARKVVESEPAAATPAESAAQVERPTPRGRKRRIAALLVLIMAGGLVIMIVSSPVSPSVSTEVSAGSEQQPASPTSPAGAAPPPGPDTAAAPEPAPAPDLEPAALYARAIAALHGLMASPSPRVQEITALALARARDERALAFLTEAVENEGMELRKIDMAYALARAGDVRAQKLLRRRLKHRQRDVRLDAARALVRLGDDAGREVLASMLDLSSHRLGAAALLARLGDGDGVRALQSDLESSSSTEETRMHVVVALGRAGVASVQGRLVEMLEDRRYQVGAADALAVLGDTAAIPALIEQLALPSLRVRAALSLRRLDATVDFSVLAAALESGQEPTRVSAAEAILILTGPRWLAERD